MHVEILKYDVLRMCISSAVFVVDLTCEHSSRVYHFHLKRAMPWM